MQERGIITHRIGEIVEAGPPWVKLSAVADSIELSLTTGAGKRLAADAAISTTPTSSGVRHDR